LGRAGKGGSLQQSVPQIHTQPELRPKEIEPTAGTRGSEQSSTTTTNNSNPNLNSNCNTNTTSHPHSGPRNTSIQPQPEAIKNPSNSNTNLKPNNTNPTIPPGLVSRQDTLAKTTVTTQHDSIPEHSYDDALQWSIGDDTMDTFGGKHMANIFADGSIPGGPMFYDMEDLTSLLSHPSPRVPQNSLESSEQRGDTFMNMTTNEPSPRFLHILEADPRLASLLLDMSRRIQQCTAISGPQDSPILDASRSGDLTPTSESDMTKLIEDAVGDLSEFLVIIQSYGGNESQDHPNVHTKIGTMTKGGLRIGIVVIMNLLSAYLQLVAIFDRIFQALCKQLESSSSDSSPDSMPGLHLTGFSLQAGNLHTKMLSHGILHQFEMIVRILGMGPELRVTDKSEQCSGLFQDERAQALLAAVSSGKGHHVALDDGCDLRAVGSLRDTIKRVQMLL
jgi:hypothetical protein